MFLRQSILEVIFSIEMCLDEIKFVNFPSNMFLKTILEIKKSKNCGRNIFLKIHKSNSINSSFIEKYYNILSQDNSVIPTNWKEKKFSKVIFVNSLNSPPPPLPLVQMSSLLPPTKSHYLQLKQSTFESPKPSHLHHIQSTHFTPPNSSTFL